MTDNELLDLCLKYGKAALEARRKFLGLLPEVARRELWRAKGFSSIFEFAFKLAGASEEQVRRVLNLDKKFTDKPLLRQLLVNGDVSVSKLARVASVSTLENQGFWADRVEVLSQAAVETLVRDEKSVRAHTQVQLLKESVKLEEDVEEELLDMQRRGIDINKLIREMLEKRREETAEEKDRLAVTTMSIKNSRYIPVKIRKLVQEEYGNKCSMMSCKKMAEIIHHTQRWAMSKNHNPNYLAPLCKEHHQIAHAVDVKVQKARVGN